MKKHDDSWMETVFAKHELTILCDHPKVKRFQFRRPDEGTYGFNLTTSDNLIVMTGDIGTLIVEPGYGRDGLAFMRGSVNSEGYFLGKCPHEFRESLTEFCRDEAMSGINEWYCQDYISRETLEKFKDRLSGESGTYGEMKYYELCHDLEIEEPPSPKVLRGQVKLQLIGLRKILEKIDSPAGVESNER